MCNVWICIIVFWVAGFLFIGLESFCYVCGWSRGVVHRVKCYIVVALLTVGFIITIFFGAKNIEDKEKYKDFIATKELVLKNRENGVGEIINSYQISQQNQWLVKAQEEVKRFGKWSFYYNYNVMNLTPIPLAQGG